MEPYILMTMAEIHRRELNADARQRRDAVRVRRAARMRDPLNTLQRVQVIWWIAVARLRRAAIETARGAR
jgi:hypothetical protein